MASTNTTWSGGSSKVFEQGVGRRRGEHVDLVDDVDLPATGRGERGSGHEIAHRVDPVVRGGVELVDVERGASGDVDAGVAHPARLAVDRARAVQSLREDPRRRGLARSSRAGEQIGVGDALVPDGMAKGADRRGPGRAPPRSAAGDTAGRGTGSRPPPEPTTWRRSRPRPGAPIPGRKSQLWSRSRRRWRAQQPGHLRHTGESAESCCLPALTRFTVASCAEPGYCARQRQQVQR